jgi:hypothetical protein
VPTASKQAAGAVRGGGGGAAGGAPRRDDPGRRGADHLVLRTDRDWLLDVVRFVVDRRARVHARRAGWGTR